jgi:hypothetical protein
MIGTENPVDVREINIRKHKDYIYLGPDNYYACEVLPEDWIDILPSSRRSALSQLTPFYRETSLNEDGYSIA